MSFATHHVADQVGALSFLTGLNIVPEKTERALDVGVAGLAIDHGR